jgi:short-subunit dehydrogenase
VASVIQTVKHLVQEIDLQLDVVPALDLKSNFDKQKQALVKILVNCVGYAHSHVNIYGI